MVLFDTATSPNNDVLVACSTFGDLFFWRIGRLLQCTKNAKVTVTAIQHQHSFSDEDSDAEDTDIGHSAAAHVESEESGPWAVSAKRHTPSFVFRASKGPIYRLKTAGDVLCVGQFDSLSLYQWNDILSAMDSAGGVGGERPHRISVSTVYRWTGPQTEHALGAKGQFSEINAIGHCPVTKCLFLGTGHCSVFRLHLDGQRAARSLEGHKEYVLDLTVHPRHSLMASASNDGSVRLWDLRQNQSTKTFHGEQSGYYSNCCELHENGKYLVSGFGGKGNKIKVFELKMMVEIAEIANGHDAVPQVVRFQNGWRRSALSNLAVVSGLNHSALRVYDEMKRGDFVPMATSLDSVWSIEHLLPSRDVAVVCGASPNIDCIASTGNITLSLAV